MNEAIEPPSVAELEAVFAQRYAAAELGWGPALRRRHGYYTPDDQYEALLARLVTPATRWLDVGCGRHLLPDNPQLARQLADRAAFLFGVDPDPTLDENPYVHDRARVAMDDFESAQRFDLVTMRMVAEHVREPDRLIASVARCLDPGGLAVVFTVDRWSPAPLLTTIVPMALRHPIKRWLWRTDKKDTFPTAFKMNSRGRLRQLFTAWGLVEAGFFRLDDCRTTARFKTMQTVELKARALLRRVHLRYPESCLLGVYRRLGSSA